MSNTHTAAGHELEWDALIGPDEPTVVVQPPPANDAPAALATLVQELGTPPPAGNDLEEKQRREIVVHAEHLARVAGTQPASVTMRQAREFMATLEAESTPAIAPPVCAAEWLAVLETLPPAHLPGLFEGGDRVCVTGQSKARKSFFILQLALSVASGRPFLFFETGTPRRVLLVNLEIKSARYQRRVRSMAAGLKLDAEDTCNLHVWNAADQPPGVALWPVIKQQADAVKAEVVIVDPLYRTFEGDESDTATVKRIVAAMNDLTARGRSFVYCHHAPKGRAGDRQTIDRGSGSGIWIRDVSTLLSIVEHGQKDLLVCEVVTRDYPPRDAQTIHFDAAAGCFRHMPHVAPEVKTTASVARASRQAAGAPVLDLEKVAALITAPMKYSDLCTALRECLGIAKHPAEQAIRAALEAGRLQRREAARAPGKAGRTGFYFGRPEQFADGTGAAWLPATEPPGNTPQTSLV